MIKHILELDSTSGAASDTGYAAFGGVKQIRWVPDAQDTGPAPAASTLTVFLQHRRNADTGLATIIYNEGSLNLGQEIHRAPRQASYTNAGAVVDTGYDFPEPYFAAGDIIKARVTGDTGTIAGELHVIVG